MEGGLGSGGGVWGTRHARPNLSRGTGLRRSQDTPTLDIQRLVEGTESVSFTYHSSTAPCSQPSVKTCSSGIPASWRTDVVSTTICGTPHT